MAKVEYTLQYLPTFYSDLEEHVMYIPHVLKNVQAANELLNDVENAILARLPDAESFEPYHSRNKRENPYYRIYVKNYVIYYVVIPNGRNKKIMEVRRILHGLQDRGKSL
jgi:hypothetical protein